MIWIKNKIIPFKGFNAITLWPFVFYRHHKDKTTENHENIHGQQQLEMGLMLGFMFFYLIYFIEWLFKGYENISFEKEAKEHQEEQEYLIDRKLYAQWRKHSI